MWQRGSFCGENEQGCPFNACLARVGDCSIARPEVGCEDPFCCTTVCEFDRCWSEQEWIYQLSEEERLAHLE